MDIVHLELKVFITFLTCMTRLPKIPTAVPPPLQPNIWPSSSFSWVGSPYICTKEKQGATRDRISHWIHLKKYFLISCTTSVYFCIVHSLTFILSFCKFNICYSEHVWADFIHEMRVETHRVLSLHIQSATLPFQIQKSIYFLIWLRMALVNFCLFYG